MRRWLLAVAPAMLALASCSDGTTFGFPDAATEQGRRIVDVWGVFMIAAIVVAGIVYAGILWSLLRYRRRRTDPEGYGHQFHANVPIEIAYTAVPILIIIGLFLISYDADRDIRELHPDPDVVLEATAFSWGWRFEYPELGVVVVSPPATRAEPGPEIVLPLDRITRVRLTSADVIHAFWVPSFNFKMDAIPGRTNEFELTPVEEGTYRGVCAEFCGIQHAYMTFRVTSASPAEFDGWIAEQRAVGATTG
ncbi:MAG TPA: cytochrome c oxidase subunit II [Actinomycetota bacterium]|nr:cytochrome c oxidase subunit II [Actinomycetota bacterium]